MLGTSAEASDDLQSWLPIAPTGSPTNNGDGTETVLYRDTVPVNDANQRFMRLSIVQKPVP
jgi:hypothetical protein